MRLHKQGKSIRKKNREIDYIKKTSYEKIIRSIRMCMRLRNALYNKCVRIKISLREMLQNCRTPKVDDISGKRFGRLVAIRYAGKKQRKTNLMGM